MLEQLREFGPGVVDQQQRGIDHLGGIVRRDVGRHADRDPARAISEQVGEQPRHDLRLFVLAIIGGTKIDRALVRSEEHTSELQSLMRISYAVFCLKKKTHYYPYSL